MQRTERRDKKSRNNSQHIFLKRTQICRKLIVVNILNGQTLHNGEKDSLQEVKEWV